MKSSIAELFVEIEQDHATLAELVAKSVRLEIVEAKIDELLERMNVAENRPLTVAQAAAALGVSQKTIRRRISNGEIQHRRVGGRIVVYLPQASVSKIR